MKAIQLKKAAQPAAEVCARFELSEEARPLLSDGMHAGDFVQALVQNEKYRDALVFMAYLLPKREAIWWGCLCLWNDLRPEPQSQSGAALDAIVEWLTEPGEAARRHTQEAARAAGGARAPEGALALAAFWSEGSMSRPNLPEVKPDPWLSHKMVAKAVAAAARKKKPRADQELAFLALAADVHNGVNPVPKKAAKKGK